MLKYSYAALGALLVFAVVVALLPEPPGVSAQSGVTLRGVSLRLYPAQDTRAEWRFRAPSITFDPLSGETDIERPEVGQRIVNGKVDTTISTDKLIIDANDNLRTQRADLYVPAQCVTVKLTGTPEKPVVIDQQSGFSGPQASVVYPDVTFTAGPAQASFDLKQTNFQNNKLTAQLDGTQDCVNGQLVPKKKP